MLKLNLGPWKIIHGPRLLNVHKKTSTVSISASQRAHGELSNVHGVMLTVLCTVYSAAAQYCTQQITHPQ